MTLQYITGGTMPAQALSYVMRDTDWFLQAKLLQGEYCYVLTPRQMGKSSLMIQTAVFLGTQAVKPAIIDLTALGQDLEPSQWYNGLMDTLAERLDLEDELDDFKRSHSTGSPLQRWQKALRQVFLEHTSGSIVIFIDEIDVTRSLRFSTDEFFAAIRACYNARTQDDAYNRLTFCLLGVATPTELISDSRLTPFNIGTRIELHDFTKEEADTLRLGLGHDDATNHLLMERIYYWAEGHPFLTQRLCQAVASNSAILTSGQVDAVCRELFLNAEKGMQDDNLLYIRQRLLSKNEEECASLLTLFRQVSEGKHVSDNETDPLVGQLKLSGAVRAEGGRLLVRNRIYRQVFDRKWIAEQMPSAEKRRQRAAYRLGVLRAFTISAVLLGVIGSLGLTAWHQSRLALEEARRAVQEHDRAEQLLYSSDMVVAQVAHHNKEYGRLAQLLTDHLPRAGQKEDLRGWEWGYYWRLMHRDRYTIHDTAKGIVCSIAFSPDGKTLTSANEGGSIQLWDTAAQQTIPSTLGTIGTGVYTLAFCPKNNGLLASGGEDHKVRIWDIATRHVTPLECTASIASLAFSLDGHSLAAGCDDGTLRVWKFSSHQHKTQFDFSHRAAHIASGVNPVYAVAFSPDGQWLASGYQSGQLKLWKAPFLHDINLPAPSPANSVFSIAFAPDNRSVAVGRRDGALEIWDVATRRKLGILPGHTDKVSGLRFSPDGKHLASGSWDNTVRLWDVARRQTIRTFIGHTSRVTDIAFSPDGTTLASCAEHEIKFWDPQATEEKPNILKSIAREAQQRDQLTLGFVGTTLYQLIVDRKAQQLTEVNPLDFCEQRLGFVPSYITGAVFSREGKTLAVGLIDGTVRLRNLQSKEITPPFNTVIPSEVGIHKEARHITFSKDGKFMAVASGDPAVVTLWEVASRRQIGHFQHSNAAEGIAFSPSDNILAIANWQGFVYLWDVAKHRGNIETKDLILWRAHTKAVTGVAFSSDGKTLATSSEDKTVKLWNVATQREMITFRDHANSVQAVAFSPDGRSLATSSLDDTIHVYYADRPDNVEASQP